MSPKGEELSLSGSQVRVGVRVRPLTSKEIQQGGKSSVSVTPPVVGIGQRRFTYDVAFDSNVSQLELYESVSAPLLKSYVDGYNATIMAYGQTGSGKTFTMGSEAHTGPESSTHTGLIPRFMQDFFDTLQKKKEASDLQQEGSSTLIEYQLSASFLEVYGEDVYDLLDRERKSLPLREDSSGGVVISGLTTRPVTNAEQALQVLHDGTMNRTTAATLMNLTSSRSHAVFTIYLKQVVRAGDVDVTNMSRFTFVDLAGSERMKKTGAEGERAREGIKINEGLLALGNVINALADEERIKEKKVHVPYRQSKLTRLLQDALGGNSQTLFLACVSPSDTNASETISTLHYANRARNIRNAPTKNVDPTAAELQRLHALTRVLQCELVKQKFCVQDSSMEDEQKIGELEESILKRKDVEEYLQELSNAAGTVGGKMMGSPLMLLPAPEVHQKHVQHGGTSTPPSATSINKLNPKTVETVSAVGDTSIMNQSICEKYDDGMLDDVDPDKDMAILDQLLELQRHDHEYDRERRKDDDQLKEVEGELEKQENMLLQLRESMKVYHDMKAKYEALMTEVQHLEAEKANLAQQLEETVNNPAAGCSAAIKRKLEKVEQSLSRARTETKKHREKYRKAEEQAKKVQVLERKINSLKHGKVALIKKQKEAAARYREVTEAKTKELMLLKRRERAQGQKLSKLETEILHHKTNLDKRKIYCEKLSDKLKQTESHLVKLLSMRQRDLSERMSFVGNSHRRASSDLGASKPNEKDKAFAPMNESVKSFNFIFETMVSEKVNQAKLKKRYEDRVAAYSDAMRKVVAEVNLLSEARKQASEMQCDENDEKVRDHEENIADLELKIELIGSELEELKKSLHNDDEGFKLDSDEAVRKMMTNMSSPVLRTLLMETFKKYAAVELDRQKIMASSERKDSALQSYENEVETLNNKIISLSNSISDSYQYSDSCDDAGTTIRRLQEEKAFFDGEARMLAEKLRDSQSRSSELEKNLHEVQRNYFETRERYALAEASLKQAGKSLQSEETLERLQEIWRELGVSSDSRDRARQDIENCLADTCTRKLQEAQDLKTQTEVEIRTLANALDSMTSALALERDQALLASSNEGSTLLDCRRTLQMQVEKLEPQYKFAIARREKLVNDLNILVDALGLNSKQLSMDLQVLLQQSQASNFVTSSNFEHVFQMSTALESRTLDQRTSKGQEQQGILPAIEEEEKDPSALDLGTIPAKCLAGEYLSRCENDIAKLRVKKAEELVRNREYQQKGFALAGEMHMKASDVVSTLHHGIEPKPQWWSEDVLDQVAQALVSETSPINATEAFSQHLKQALLSLESVAEARRSLSTTLRSTVERAQKTLLDIVGREVDATEAYASFHDALFRLPSLSEELVKACISEMEALVVGVEAMTESEIEALTVVWEALGVTSKERREFWGQVEESAGDTLAIEEKNPFTAVSALANTSGEEWVISATETARGKFDLLEQRLSKLEGIHNEVERLKSRQDTKSSILSLDSEVRILNANLLDFEDTKCNKQRLLTKKSGGTTLLKEERFRKQMQSKFTSKLEQLASLLRVWEKEQGEQFDASVLSDDVRMLLSTSPDKMEQIVEKRTKLMPLRTVQSTPAGKKRPLEGNDQDRSSSDGNRHGASVPRSKLTPPRKRQARGTTSNTTSGPPSSTRDDTKLHPQQMQKKSRPPVPIGNRRNIPPTGRVPPKKLEQNENTTAKSAGNKSAPAASSSEPQVKRQLRKRESAALLPFGQILSPAQKRRQDDNRQE